MKLGTVIFGCAFLIFMVAVIVGEIHLTQDVRGHLKRAADANQPELAIEELQTALVNANSKGLCISDGNYYNDCYTSVIYKTPDEDLRFWAVNLQQALTDLQELPEDADHLMVSNTLMKVRETLLDSSQSGDTVTIPSGAARYPNNALWGFGGLILFAGLVICGVLWLKEW